MVFDWNDDKNTLLKESQNVCFEDVVTSIQEDKLLDIVKNSSANYQSQYCLIVEIMNYAYIVPFVNEGETFFLKTIYPSRKQTKKYIKE
ncbi:MAG: toxin [Sulfuricurvum sp.]